MSQLLAALLALALWASGAYAWNTETQDDSLGWMAVYLENPQAGALPASGWTRNEHTELTHVILTELGVASAFGMKPVGGPGTTVVDLNAYYQSSVRAAEPFGDDPTTQLEERRVSPPAHFAGLPDYSWAVHDWINKNTLCPLTDGAPYRDSCHLFAGWMGALNANHFGTQSRNMYTRYHRIALTLAHRARSLREALAAPHFPADADAYREFVKEGELEALIYEAVGQHFLEDRWATGHMWERWNGADEATAAPFEESFVVAAAAGLMHGSEGITKLPDPMGSPQVVSAPLGDTAVPVRWRLLGLEPRPGVGDYRLADMHDGLFGAEFGFADLPINVAEQRARMFACAKAGWAEVIRAFGERSPGRYGEHDVSLVGGPFPSILDDDSCWEAWATNRAMAVGWLEHPSVSNIAQEARSVGVFASTSIIGELRRRLLPYIETTWRIAVAEALDDPDGTNLAMGGIGSVGDVPNGRSFPLPSYTEPEDLDTLPERDRTARGRDKHALYGFFNRAHADWWCENFESVLFGVRGTRDPVDEEFCAYVADRVYKGTDPAYKGKQRETRQDAGQDVDPICSYYGVMTAGVDEDLPYHLHPGYVSTPGFRRGFSHDSIAAWCRKAPVVDAAPCAGTPAPPPATDDWDVVARVPETGGAVSLHGRNFGDTAGNVDAGRGATFSTSLSVASWTDTEIRLSLPAGMLDEGDWFLRICLPGLPVRCSVGRFILRVGSGSGAVIQSTFDTDTEGWTQDGASEFSNRPSGGNPGGFLYIDNSEGPITVIYAPAAFHGDLSGFIGGTLSFDGNMLDIGGDDYETLGDYGHVTIYGGGGGVSLDLVPGRHTGSGVGNPPRNTWTTFSVSLDAATWGQTEAQWRAILSDVTEINLSVEALFGAEIQGIDNFRLEGGVCSAGP